MEFLKSSAEFLKLHWQSFFLNKICIFYIKFFIFFSLCAISHNSHSRIRYKKKIVLTLRVQHNYYQQHDRVLFIIIWWYYWWYSGFRCILTNCTRKPLIHNAEHLCVLYKSPHRYCSYFLFIFLTSLFFRKVALANFF